MGEVIATILGLSRGLGQTLTLLSSSATAYVSESFFASIVLYLLSATLTKVSTLYLMMRLFNLHGRKSQTNHHDRHRLYLNTCFAILVIMLAFGVASITAVSVRCITVTSVLPPDESQCPSQYLRWQIITGFDVATEALLVLNTIMIVTPVQLALDLKFQVVCAFALRLPLIALAILRLHYVKNATTAGNPGTAQEPIMVLQQAYLCWSIISATLPNLKAFVRSFGSGFGIGIDMETYTNAYGSKQKSYEMKQMSATQGHGSTGRSITLTERDGTEHAYPKSSVSAQQRHGQPLPKSSPGQSPEDPTFREVDSIESTGSDAQIIRKDVSWTVRHENGDASYGPRVI